MHRTKRFPWVLAALAALAASAQAAPIEVDASKVADPALPDCGFQRAIDEAAAAPEGGIVRLPEGVFALRRGLVLKDKVQIVGAGMDKTVLTPARRTLRLEVARPSPDAQGNVHLADIPEGLEVGSALIGESRYPPSWYGSPRPGFVTAVDREAKTIAVEWPYGANAMKPGQGFLAFGTAAAIEKSVKKGDTEVVLKSASLIRPGDEITLGTPDNESMLAHAFVKDVRGNTLVLESPARCDFEAWPDKEKIGNTKVNALVWLVFPMIHAANVSDAGVRDLTVRGHGFERIHPLNTRYTLSGIHIFNGKNLVFERVAVRDWPADGISLQTGENCRVLRCEATGNIGNGFHPGTGLKNTLFEECLSQGNGAGIYFCWHNNGHVIRNCRILENRGGGVTGLGNPGDRNNTIEKCEIARNGGPGVEINGGQKSGNVIRDNVIENNSRSAPGKHPGIALYASLEDARAYTITGNTIRDTQEVPTQFVGIEEKNGTYRDKPTAADENIIRGNRFSGHRTADIILAGPNTVCEDNGEAKVVKDLPAPAEGAAPQATGG